MKEQPFTGDEFERYAGTFRQEVTHMPDAIRPSGQLTHVAEQICDARDKKMWIIYARDRSQADGITPVDEGFIKGMKKVIKAIVTENHIE